jgi:hypothetical protein
MAGKLKLLTKSNYLLGLQCSKLLHVKLYDKKRIPDYDESAYYRFKVGDKTEELAKTLFPGGIDIPREDFLKNLELSREFIEKRVPLFEPSFKFHQLYSRADVLVPVNEDEWDIVEMKSATKVKEVNLHDVSFQKYIYESCGLKIRKCFLMHINKGYIKNGEIETDKLFTKTDITSEVDILMENIEERIQPMLVIINNGNEPAYEIGRHCYSPYDCPMRKECWADLPDGNILEFYKKEKVQAFDLGEIGLFKIPRVSNYDLEKNGGNNPFQKQMEATNEGEGFEKRILSEFFGKIKYPICYLDIAAINPAIPRFDGMRPYQKIPYQFSLHIQREYGGPLEHFDYLSSGNEDPRIPILSMLKDNIGNTGTILVLDKHRINSILRDLAWNFNDFSFWINQDLIPRMISLWDLLDNFHYFDIDGKLVSKIKYKIPRLSNLSHDDLNIRDSESRGYEFEEMLFGEVDQNLMNGLKEEAKGDTSSMAGVLKILKGLY